MTKEDLMTRQEAIAYLKINASTLWRWEQRGLVKRYGGLGNKVYYSRKVIDRAITRNQ